MSAWAYYQDIDEEKCAWVRELIKAGVVTDGEVDCRDIKLVTADDVRGFRRVHFFCGIAVWDYALNRAGWGDAEIWTGSCPCPSFSCAGKGEGFDDPRHLWPEWFRLIRECRPRSLAGEQVAAAIGHGWYDLVCGDLEAEGYAVAAAVLGAHSSGAPHIRQRLYFGAFSDGGGRERSELQQSGVLTGRSQTSSPLLSPYTDLCTRFPGEPRAVERARPARFDAADSSGSHPNGRQSSNGDLQRSGEQRLLTEDRGTGEHSDTTERGQPVCGSAPGSAGHTPRTSEPGSGNDSERTGLEGQRRDVRERRGPGWLDPITARSIAETGATRGFWADCDWWYGRDIRWRPIEPGLQPLVAGLAKGVRHSGDPSIENVANTSEARVLRLRGYGDSITAPVAAAFIQAFMEAIHGS